MQISEKGAGIIYVHPKHTHTSIRIMPGKPHSPLPYQQKPYVIHKKDEKVLDRFGNKNFQITEIQLQILKRFDEQFRNFYTKNDWLPFFIDTPEWNEITELAKKTLQAFNYQKQIFILPISSDYRHQIFRLTF